MSAFLNILTNIMLPIFILIGVGYGAQKILHMDAGSLARINIYVFVPAVLFTKIYEADITLELFLKIAGYVLAISAVMYLLGEAAARLLKYPRGKRKAFENALVFFNSGNYGIPLVDLAFQGNSLAISVQVFIMLIQNVVASTFGVFQASTGSTGYKKALKNVLSMPVPYVMLLVSVIKISGLQMPEFFMVPLRNISGGFVTMALITLGIQLADVSLSFKLKDIFLPSFIRLILTPVIAFFLIKAAGIQGILAKSLILGVATPTAVTTAIIAKEYNNEPAYTSQIVFFSTLFSVLTVTGILFLLQYI